MAGILSYTWLVSMFGLYWRRSIFGSQLWIDFWKWPYLSMDDIYDCFIFCLIDYYTANQGIYVKKYYFKKFPIYRVCQEINPISSNQKKKFRELFLKIGLQFKNPLISLKCTMYIEGVSFFFDLHNCKFYHSKIEK